MDNKIEKDVLKKSFTQIFAYQLDEVNKDARYNAYLVPLRWFVKLYTRRTHKITMGDIAMQMGTDLATFSKMLHHGVTKDNRRITAEHINRICEIIDIPLSSILFLYEYKEDVEKKLWRDDFEKLTNLLRGNFDEILYPAIFYDINSGKKVSKPANTKDSTSSSVSKNSILEPIRGKWYFYFPSSDSEIKNQREKTLKKNPNHVPESPELLSPLNLALHCQIVRLYLLLECQTLEPKNSPQSPHFSFAENGPQQLWLRPIFLLRSISSCTICHSAGAMMASWLPST